METKASSILTRRDNAVQRPLYSIIQRHVRSKKAWLFIDFNDKKWREAGYRIAPPSAGQRDKGLAAALFMFHGRLGLFRQLLYT